MSRLGLRLEWQPPSALKILLTAAFGDVAANARSAARSARQRGIAACFLALFQFDVLDFRLHLPVA